MILEKILVLAADAVYKNFAVKVFNLSIFYLKYLEDVTSVAQFFFSDQLIFFALNKKMTLIKIQKNFILFYAP